MHTEDEAKRFSKAKLTRILMFSGKILGNQVLKSSAIHPLQSAVVQKFKNLKEKLSRPGMQPATYFFVTRMATLRFISRPSSVLLSATGCSDP